MKNIEQKCKHCGEPISYLQGIWVHNDPDEDPQAEDYGWVKCSADPDGSFEYAEPMDTVKNDVLLSASGRPLSLTIDKPTPCCGVTLIIECDGTYRCACGRRQERIAKATILAGLFEHKKTKTT